MTLRRDFEEAPRWGTAKVRKRGETLYWECEVDAEEGVTETKTITLAADTFKAGTIIRIYEPVG